MKVLVIAPTGVNVKTALQNMQLYFKRLKGYPDDQGLLDRSLGYYILEEEIRNKVTFNAYLDADDYKYQEQIWHEAFETLRVKIEKTNHNNVFFCINYPYFRDDRFFPAIDMNAIKKFNPDLIVTFIEDAYATWKRIQKRESERPTRSIFRLRDMFTWRTTSILLADIIAKNIGKINYVVPVKHPPIMLYRLIFEREQTPLIYASFPITFTRDKPDRRAEIDAFRIRLAEEFCVFDPLTIDDRVLKFAYEKHNDGSNISIRKADRWPIPSDYSLVNDDDVWDGTQEFTIPKDQADEVVRTTANSDKSVIDKHIAYRDYRSVSTADVLVAYRPFFEKHAAKGVAAEIQHANQVAHVPCYFCWNKNDGDPAESPFTGKGTIEYDLNKIIQNIRDRGEELIRRRITAN